jgi:hypothetical protein
VVNVDGARAEAGGIAGPMIEGCVDFRVKIMGGNAGAVCEYVPGCMVGDNVISGIRTAVIAG